MTESRGPPSASSQKSAASKHPSTIKFILVMETTLGNAAQCISLEEPQLLACIGVHSIQCNNQEYILGSPSTTLRLLPWPPTMPHSQNPTNIRGQNHLLVPDGQTTGSSTHSRATNSVFRLSNSVQTVNGLPVAVCFSLCPSALGANQLLGGGNRIAITDSLTKPPTRPSKSGMQKPANMSKPSKHTWPACPT